MRQKIKANTKYMINLISNQQKKLNIKITQNKAIQIIQNYKTQAKK